MPLSSCPGCAPPPAAAVPGDFRGSRHQKQTKEPELQLLGGAPAPALGALERWRGEAGPKPTRFGGGSWKWCQGWRGERRGAGGAGRTAGVPGEQLVMGGAPVCPLGKGGPSASGGCVRGWRGQHGDSGVPRVGHSTTSADGISPAAFFFFNLQSSQTTGIGDPNTKPTGWRVPSPTPPAEGDSPVHTWAASFPKWACGG